MDDRTYRRLFQETPRQRRIRHNWPSLCGQMTKAERRQHVEGLREHARSLRKKGDRRGAELTEEAADRFEATYPWKKGKARTVVWGDRRET